MSIAYAGFIAMGLVVIVALCVWLCMSHRAALRRKRLAAQQQQSSEESPARQGFQPDEFDYYFGQNDNTNGGTQFRPTNDVYYGDRPQPFQTQGESRTQPVVPAVVMSVRQTRFNGQYPVAQPVAGTMPYGQTAVEVHPSGGGGVYGEAEYLPGPPTCREASVTVMTAEGVAEAETNPRARCAKEDKPVMAEEAAQPAEEVAYPTETTDRAEKPRTPTAGAKATSRKTQKHSAE